MLAACSHEAENTGAQNAGVMTLPPQNYAMLAQARPGVASAAPQSPQGSSACAQGFDQIMDRLEGLMAAEQQQGR